MRRGLRGGATLLCALAAAACGQETPTELGEGLLPSGLIRTFTVVLEPESYLLSDTAASIYGAPFEVIWTVVANQFEGAADARLVAMMPTLPRQVTVRDEGGALVTDTAPTLVRAEVILVVDTLRSRQGAEAVTLDVHHIGERWDPFSATWDMRVDTAGDRLPWTQAGGTTAGVAGTGTWTRGDTIVSIGVDAAAVEMWRDTEEGSHGALVAAQTVDSRLRIQGMRFQVSYTTELNFDTLVVFTAEVPVRSFVHTPIAAGGRSDPRIGGLPAWRTFLRLRPGLDTVTVPCPDVPDCRLRLSDVSVTRATLELVPVPQPPGFALEDSLRITAREVLVTEGVPLARSPLGEAVGVSTRAVPPGRGALPETVPVTVTELIRGLTMQAPDDPQFRRPQPFLALLPSPELATLGFADFQSLPRLRLVLTVATEIQLR